MINWKSILSSYDDKPTLLQWLKMVKKALDESVLETVTVEQPTDTTAVLSFNFADGTSIKAPAITLPRGVQGAKGDKGTEIVSMTVYHTEVVGDKTNTQINVQYNDHPSDTFTVSAQNGKDGAKGADGANGVSITGIDTVSDEVVGDETLTTLRAHYSNNTSDEVVVTAKNGKDGAKYYRHVIDFKYGDRSETFAIPVLSKKNTFLTNAEIATTVKDNTIAIINRVNTAQSPQTYDFVLCVVQKIEFINGQLKLTYKPLVTNNATPVQSITVVDEYLDTTDTNISEV